MSDVDGSSECSNPIDEVGVCHLDPRVEMSNSPYVERVGVALPKTLYVKDIRPRHYCVCFWETMEVLPNFSASHRFLLGKHFEFSTIKNAPQQRGAHVLILSGRSAATTRFAAHATDFGKV